MNVFERMNNARPTAPKRPGDIDQLQYLLDKAARLASAPAHAPAVAATPVPYESDAARQTRLLAALNDARAGAMAKP